MNRRLLTWLAVCFLGFNLCLAQDLGTYNSLAERARREFKEGKFGAAERDFRELVKRTPTDLYAQTYLGHALFRQQKFVEAVTPYETAYGLERRGTRLAAEDHRVLVDQLVMSYGISGQFTKARALLKIAIREDPDYPLNYYNLACAYAEEGDKARLLTNLQLAFDRKANILKGEQMPDPRADSSFERFFRDSDFMALMQKLGYK